MEDWVDMQKACSILKQVNLLVCMLVVQELMPHYIIQVDGMAEAL